MFFISFNSGRPARRELTDAWCGLAEQNIAVTANDLSENRKEEVKRL